MPSKERQLKKKEVIIIILIMTSSLSSSAPTDLNVEGARIASESSNFNELRQIALPHQQGPVKHFSMGTYVLIDVNNE